MKAVALLLLALWGPSVWAGPAAEQPGSPVPQAQDADKEDPAESLSCDTGSFWSHVVPVPIVITEPAVGNGLGVGVGYFHPECNPGNTGQGSTLINAEEAMQPFRTRRPPPKVTGIAAGYTAKGTKFIGAGHANTFKDDRWRLMVAGGWADVYADIYVLGVPFEFNLTGSVLFADVRRRLGDSDIFVGVTATYLSADNRFVLNFPDRDPIGLFDFDLRDTSLTGELVYDGRDDSMFPTKGQYGAFSVAVHSEDFSGDYNYELYKLKALTFNPLGQRWVLSGRVEAQHVEGRPPFFAVPWVSLRGVPALRYQSESVALGEAEVRYLFAPRWTGLAFGGLGWKKRKSDFQEDPDIYNLGIGVRFRFKEAENVWMGLDIARGPEDTHWYIQVGQAW